MKKKIKFLEAGLSCVIAMALTAAWADSTSYWDPKGSGNWADASRWVSGNVPQEGYQVRLSGDTYATDADRSVLEKVGAIVLPGNDSVFTIKNDGDMSIASSIMGEGKVVKSGEGTMNYAWTSNVRITTLGGFEVTAGRAVISTKVTDVLAEIPMSVLAGGTLEFVGATSVSVKGLNGDGVIANGSENAIKLMITSGTREKPYVFSGSFEGSVALGQSSGYGQQFWGRSADIVANGLDLRNGYIGAALLPQENLVFRDNAIFEYLGSEDAQSASKNVMYVNSAQSIELDAGWHGGITVNYGFINPGDKYTIDELVLSGSNTSVAVFNGSFTMGKTADKSQNLACYLKKKGTGTWRFTDAVRANRGTVAVEEGTLEYESIAEKGVGCSLGDATVLQSEYTGAYDASKNVDYAYLLGDGTNPDSLSNSVATMLYAGDANATIAQRPVALNGAGRFASQFAALDWSGFTAVSLDSQLVLGGDAAGCVARSISKGQNHLAVSKDGAGDWTIDGAVEADALYSREGTLSVRSTQGYTWYKISFNKVRGSNRLVLRHIALWNDSGLLSDALSFKKEKTGKCPELLPGEVTFEFLPDAAATVNNNIGAWFVNDDSSATATAWKTVGDVSSSCIVLIIRLPEGKESATHCDFRVVGDSTSMSAYDPVSWTVSASRDGVNWVEVGGCADLAYEPSTARKGAWCSEQTFTGLWTDKSHSAGFALSTEGSRPTAFADGAPLVGAAEGAVLKAYGRCPAGGVLYDYALGGGTVEGFDFSSATTLRLVNIPAASAGLLLPMDFRNCEGMDAMGSWDVIVNGRKGNKKAVCTDDGICLVGTGFAVIIR